MIIKTCEIRWFVPSPLPSLELLRWFVSSLHQAEAERTDKYLLIDGHEMRGIKLRGSDNTTDNTKFEIKIITATAEEVLPGKTIKGKLEEMTKYISIMLFFLFCACKANKPRESYIIPNSKDINDIIEAIIYQNDLPVLKNIKIKDTIYNKNGKKKIISRESLPLSINLEKLRTILFDTAIAPPPDALSINKLLAEKVNGSKFFKKSDSAYFIFQNDTLKKFNIAKDIADKLLVTTNAKEKEKLKSKKPIPYYRITIPIFSKDNKKAYVRVSFYCYFCGYTTAIYLKKVNNKWTIVKVQDLWES